MADPRDTLAAELRARAEALEEELAGVILELDADAVARLAQAALQIGFTADEVEALFARAVTRHLETAYDLFANETSERYGLPPAYAAAQAEAETAIAETLADLTAEGVKVITRLVEQAGREGWGVAQLARQIEGQVVLTEQQNAWVANFERKLRTDHRRALRNALRDKRSDRRLRRGEALSESEIASMTARYHARMVRYRGFGIARTELLRASNGASLATWLSAENSGALPAGVRKFWRHMHDAKVRESHIEIPGLNPDGVKLDESFVTPLGKLRYPLDPLGVAADVVGCRCILLFDTVNPAGAL